VQLGVPAEQPRSLYRRQPALTSRSSRSSTLKST